MVWGWATGSRWRFLPGTFALQKSLLSFLFPSFPTMVMLVESDKSRLIL